MLISMHVCSKPEGVRHAHDGASAHANFAVTSRAGDQVPKPSTSKPHDEQSRIHLQFPIRDPRVKATQIIEIRKIEYRNGPGGSQQAAEPGDRGVEERPQEEG